MFLNLYTSLALPEEKCKGNLRDYSVPDFRCSFSWWEEVLEDLNDALAELCGEAFEDEMWVAF
jgi:hypothetical protein